jgi:preprotein translocase subunit SecG
MNEMSDNLPLFFIVLAILLFGVAILKVAVWSRKKNAELKKKHEDSQALALRKILNSGDLKTGVANYFASSASKSEAIIGKTLAVTVIVFIMLLALLVSYFLWFRI